ncbi:hypothetical protein D777_02432 [Marinobacter nitratireducens]|uniref:DUF4440 domain-containing protein n=1 Tax=Marinobacter nitratireducens TaxID=1137280 RepID=A0A072NBN5_9GAMM|nr:hypothetical protein [Marinobacter nitratireducens]KEF30490.1 hypothetical protein D777_02432 [Marinobacter nitratireducens]
MSLQARILASALLLFPSSVALAADTLADRAEIDSKTAAFMATAQKGKIENAYQSLEPFLGVDAAPYQSSAKEAASYFTRVIESVGHPIGTAHVKTEVIGEHFTRQTWLQKFEAAAIAWRFTYYQPDSNGWKLVGVSYSTELESLYQTAD